MDDPEKHAKSKKPITKDHVLDDYIYMQCPAEANPQGRKQMSGCLGLGENEGWLLKRFSFWGDENVSKNWSK